MTWFLTGSAKWKDIFLVADQERSYNNNKPAEVKSTPLDNSLTTVSHIYYSIQESKHEESSDEDSYGKRKRCKVSDEKTWKKNERNLKQNKGQEYISSSGK